MDSVDEVYRYRIGGNRSARSRTKRLGKTHARSEHEECGSQGKFAVEAILYEIGS